MTAVSLADALDNVSDQLGWLGEVPPLWTRVPWDGKSKPIPQITFEWLFDFDRNFPKRLAEEARQDIAYLKGPELAAEFKSKIDIIDELRRWDRRRADWEREPHERSELYCDTSTLGFKLHDEFEDIREQALHAERFVRRLAYNVRADHGPKLDWNPPADLSNDAKELWKSLKIKLLGERGCVFRLPHGELETDAQVETALNILKFKELVEVQAIEGSHKRFFRVNPPYAEALARPKDQEGADLQEHREPQKRSRKQRKPRPPVVHLDAQQIFLDGVYYDLTETATTIMDTLIKAGGRWVSGKSLKASEGSRPDMIMSKMPQEVQDLIEGHTKNGYRIQRARP